MNIIYVFITINSWVLAVRSQRVNTQNQYQRNDVTINPDQIYFGDSRHEIDRNVQQAQVKENKHHSKGDVKNNVYNRNNGQESYIQATSTNTNFGYYSTPNPNINLSSDGGRYNVQQFQPPTYNNIPDYYTNNYNNNEYDTAGGLGNRNIQEKHQFNNLSLALTNFGLNLLKNSNPQARNVVMSPYSIATLLAVLQHGALGATQQQISAALQMTPETSANSLKKTIDEIQRRNSRNILKIANNVFVTDVFELNPAFKTVASQYFGSETTPIKFTRSQEAAQKINRWVADKTNNKIQNLLAPDALGENSQVVLVNAVYFKGLWQVKFKPESTLPRPFFFSERESKIIPFMRMRRIFRAGFDKTNNAQVLILPFENEQYSLMLILPSVVSSLNAITFSMTVSQLEDYHNFSPKEIDIEIPKFAVRADTDLNQILRAMGVTNMFSNQAELSGLGTYQTYSPQVSAAVHTAMLSIDEEGGTAAAATAFAVVALSYDEPSLVFKANRPFLAVLWDNQFSIPLFMAKVVDPVV